MKIKSTDTRAIMIGTRSRMAEDCEESLSFLMASLLEWPETRVSGSGVEVNGSMWPPIKMPWMLRSARMTQSGIGPPLAKSKGEWATLGK